MSERTGINWVQVSAAALAAVSSAVVLSTLGVAGTLIGAALGSVTASLGSSIYSRGIDLSKRRVAAQAAALRRVSAAQADLDEAADAARSGDPEARNRMDSAGQELHEAERVLQEETGEAGEGSPEDAADADPADAGRTGMDVRRLPWKRITVLAVTVFVMVMGVITAFELVTGRAVSAYTGGSDTDTGSTFGGTVKDLGGGRSDKPGESPSPTDGATEGATESPTEEPTEEPTTATSEPTAESSPTETSTPTESETPGETLPTETPVVSPTPEETPGAGTTG